MEIRDNRIFVPLMLTATNGTGVLATFWVDSGGDSVILSGRRAHQLGLRRGPQASVGMDSTTLHPATKPKLSMSGMPIDLTDIAVSAAGSETDRNAFAGIDASGFLPATVLKRYEVIFDYPKHLFTLAKSGTLVHIGTPVKVAVQPKTGLARVEIQIGQQKYGFMFDTGAAYTGVSKKLMDRWINEHPAWPHSMGAVGAANMVGKDYDSANELLRIPEVKWGSFVLRNVGMVSRPTGTYENNVSADMARPIIGTLSGNVLRHFRIDLDYPAEVAYLQWDPTGGNADLDCVGLIVQVNRDGTVMVSGASQNHGHPEIPGVRAGDLLLRVDEHDVSGASLASILQYLSGPVGERKRLTFRRGTNVFSINAFASRHP